MKRTITTLLALGAAFSISISAPVLAQEAKPAAAKKASAAPAKAAKGQKICKTKLPSGQIKTWTCGADQPCCESHALGLYTCGSQLLQCF